MGVYLPNLEMPENCFECPWRCKVDPENLLCRISGEYFEETFSGAIQNRHKSCPLVPVPPHGRLIDADAYSAEMKKRQDSCAAWRDDIKNGGGYGTELYYRADSALAGFAEARLTLDKIPTIIEAEEGE